MGEPSLGSAGWLEELPDSWPRSSGGSPWELGKVATRNRKWGQAGESRVLTTTTTERIPASALDERR